MNPVILFRKDFSKQFGYDQEYEDCKKYLRTETLRSKVPPGSMVIGRYSVLPYYRELQADLLENGSQLINSPNQHHWISDFHWYEDLKDFTPRTWKESNFKPLDHPTNRQFVVKGVTNSRKHEWDSMMFAKSPRGAIETARRLRLDSLIGTQEILFREYVPLETFEIGINGLPFTNEWRFFCLGTQIVDRGYYWSIAECAEDMEEPPVAAEELVRKLMPIVSKNTNFYVLDVAKTQSGKWILIEINDGQQSGLNTIDSLAFYSNLKYCLKKTINL